MVKAAIYRRCGCRLAVIHGPGEGYLIINRDIMKIALWPWDRKGPFQRKLL